MTDDSTPNAPDSEPPPEWPPIGEQLRAARIKRGMTLGEVERKSMRIDGTPALTRPGLSKIEHGSRYPSLSTLETLAECLGVYILIGPEKNCVLDAGRVCVKEAEAG